LYACLPLWLVIGASPLPFSHQTSAYDILHSAFNSFPSCTPPWRSHRDECHGLVSSLPLQIPSLQEVSLVDPSLPFSAVNII
jgi:hypothetical protein